MYILDVTCSDYGIIQIVKIIKTVFEMIQIIGPILAMVSLAIIFLGSVMGDNKTLEENKKKIINCLLALVITFFLPIFVNLVMGITFMKNTFEVSACWKAAASYKMGNSKYINKKKKHDESNTFIINPDSYKGTSQNPNQSLINNNGNSNSSVISSSEGTSLSNAFVNLAVAQLNDPSHIGGEKYWRFAGATSHMLWCSEFVTWNVFHTEYNGLKLTSILSKKCISSQCWADYCKSSNKTTFHNSGSYVPKEGDLMFFNYNGKGISHIGIVRSSDGKMVYTIEGNVSDKVMKRTIPIKDKHTVGYCSWY